jgi:tetratricopeptide (TPR) repeat protein
MAAAAAAFQEALRLRPDFFWARYNLSLALLQTPGKLVEAEASCREALRLRPANALAHHLLGLALADQGQLAAAVPAYREAIRLRPDLAIAHSNLGSALAAQGQLVEAIAAHREAIRLKPDYGVAHHGLGEALRDQGRFREALASLRQGHELGASQPRFPAAQSAADIRRVERFVELDGDLPAFLAGQRRPADPDEQIELASLCRIPAKRLYASAARWFADAFAARPDLMDDLEAGHRYQAACAAALAGCGRGEDAAKLSAAEQARWRQQARTWLDGELALLAKKLASGLSSDRLLVQSTLTRWQTDRDLAGLRDANALAKLPADEQALYRPLWDDVAALLRRAESP